MANKEKERTGIHVTSLLNCLTKVTLGPLHDLYISPAQTYWTFRGQLAHPGPDPETVELWAGLWTAAGIEASQASAFALEFLAYCPTMGKAQHKYK